MYREYRNNWYFFKRHGYKGDIRWFGIDYQPGDVFGKSYERSLDITILNHSFKWYWTGKKKVRLGFYFEIFWDNADKRLEFNSGLNRS